MRRSLIQRKLAKLDRLLDKAIEKAEIPGAVVLATIPRDGERIDHCTVRGHAVTRPERIAMQRDTLFDLASLTKVMCTTTLAAQLVDEGRISLDDPVAKLLPAFAERDKEAVTLRHLLTHSSGLKPWRPFHEGFLEKERKTGEHWIGTPAAREAVIDGICRSALVHAPGTAAVYGDLDMIVLGAVIEAVEKEPLEHVFQRRVAAPLGLAQTRFLPLCEDGVPQEIPRERIAASENCPWRDRIVWGEVHDPNAAAMGGTAGHAGLFAPADDVLRFATAWLDAWHGRSDVLPAASVREFARRQGLPENSDWALGWDTPAASGSSAGQHFGPQSIGHLGFTGTSLWIDLESEAIVVMLTNRVHLVAKKSRFTLRALVHDAILEAFQA